MTKRDIMNKVRGDIVALELLIKSQFASDLKIKLEAKLDYTKNLIEWIEQEGMV